MANTLYLRFEAPLQAWGERGRWSVRDSAPEPTKSGVIGLVGCAMGVADDATLRHISEHTRLGVRVDRPGVRLTDYHTIGGGYAEPMLLTAQGKPKKSSGRPHTEISLRDYLCDAVFLVALWSADESLIARMASAVQAPVWTIFLGRKACPPALPVFHAVATTPDVEAAIRQAGPLRPVACRPKGCELPPAGASVYAVIETDPTQGSLRRDNILSRRFRRFAPRYTRTIELAIPAEEGTP